LPLACVQEVLNFNRAEVSYVDGRDILDVRGETLPLIYLRRWLGLEAPERPGECVIVVNVGATRVGVVTDQVRGREEVVVKPLPAAVRGLAGLAGATIIADGNLALILDVPRLRDVA
jgi:two-component system chemotaxis sensor kinase CheA